MIKRLKSFITQLVAGANVVTVVLMVLVGFSDRVNPTEHPLLSTFGMAFPVLLLLNMLFLFFWLLFSWRKAWIPIAGFLFAYVPITIYLPLNLSESVPDGAIKLLSYNVCSYGGNFKYENGFKTVCDYIASEAPDIVCVQEDVDTWRHYTFREYEKIGLTYNDTVEIVNTRKSQNSIGIHTRFPIVRRDRIAYTSEVNGSAAWWLKVGDDTLIVVNNHFESCHLNPRDRQQYRQIIRGELSGDSARAESKLLLVKLAEANAKRAPQIRAVLDYVQAHKGYPVLVCGDFNDSPISYSRHVMAQQLTDCYVATGRGVGLSYNQKAFSLRIDHLFCSQDVQPYNCKINGEMDASDHNPLVCWLKIRPKP